MSEQKIVQVDLDGLAIGLVVVVFLLLCFKCSGVVLWGPNEPERETPVKEVAP